MSRSGTREREASEPEQIVPVGKTIRAEPLRAGHSVPPCLAASQLAAVAGLAPREVFVAERRREPAPRRASATTSPQRDRRPSRARAPRRRGRAPRPRRCAGHPGAPRGRRASRSARAAPHAGQPRPRRARPPRRRAQRPAPGRAARPPMRSGARRSPPRAADATRRRRPGRAVRRRWAVQGGSAR